MHFSSIFKTPIINIFGPKIELYPTICSYHSCHKQHFINNAYSYFFAYHENGNIVLKKVVNWTYTDLDSYSSWDSNWHIFEIKDSSSNVTVYRDDNQILSADIHLSEIGDGKIKIDFSFRLSIIIRNRKKVIKN